jgi:nucleotide-binding universal stress UspA family protein
MSKAAMPTLAVRPDADSLPRLAMVATDFGNASWEAAHIAANLVNPGGTVILTHVALPSYPAVDDGDEGQTLIHRLGVDGAFQRLATEIKTDKSIDVKFVKREGDAGTELLAAAEQINPDVIATASQRHHLLARMLLGSVSRKLVREGKWSMLVTPPPNTH